MRALGMRKRAIQFHDPRSRAVSIIERDPANYAKRALLGGERSRLNEDEQQPRNLAGLYELCVPFDWQWQAGRKLLPHNRKGWRRLAALPHQVDGLQHGLLQRQARSHVFLPDALEVDG